MQGHQYPEGRSLAKCFVAHAKRSSDSPLSDIVHGGQEITNSKILSHVILLPIFVKYVSFCKGHRLFLNKNCVLVIVEKLEEISTKDLEELEEVLEKVAEEKLDKKVEDEELRELKEDVEAYKVVSMKSQ